MLPNLYECILNEEKLTKKILKKYGIDSKDIKELIENKKLKRNKIIYYIFLDVDGLFYYGKSLISANEKEKAINCFKKCHQLDPTHGGVIFQLFLNSIQKKDYQMTFEYFDKLYNTNDNEFYKKDYNYYLYLLSIITEIPEKYRNIVKNFEYEDICINNEDKRYNDIPLQNKTRKLAFDQKFGKAINSLNKIVKRQPKNTVQDKMSFILLKQAHLEQFKIKKWIIHLINNNKYQELIEYLNNLENKQKLSINDQYVLKVALELENIIKTETIPKKQVLNATTIYEAIDRKNYEVALKLSLEYLEKTNIDVSTNPLHLILNQITEKIKLNIEKRTKSNNNFDAEKIIESKLDELNKDRIVILEPMDKEQRTCIHEVIENISNICSFSIGEEHDKQIVLRFHSKPLEQEELFKTINAGKEAYNSGDYDTCISLYNKLLEVGKPKASVYVKLGLAHMKKGNKSLAVKYLTVATKLSAKEKMKYDFTELIDKLQRIEVPKEDRKTTVNMYEEEFDDMSNNYGIENLNEIIEKIMLGEDIEKVFLDYELSENEKAIIYLVLAKQYYADEKYQKGDRYIKSTEKIKDKSPLVKLLLYEVRKNKNYYKYRNEKN